MEATDKLITLGALAYFLGKLDARYQHQEEGMDLSANDFTNYYKEKLDSMGTDARIATLDEVDEVLNGVFGTGTGAGSRIATEEEVNEALDGAFGGTETESEGYTGSGEAMEAEEGGL